MLGKPAFAPRGTEQGTVGLAVNTMVAAAPGSMDAL
jgi:hypothetical protein